MTLYLIENNIIIYLLRKMFFFFLFSSLLLIQVEKNFKSYLIVFFNSKAINIKAQFNIIILIML